jgi:hypothetical protein
MSSFGQVALKQIWEMLDACGPNPVSLADQAPWSKDETAACAAERARSHHVNA